MGNGKMAKRIILWETAAFFGTTQSPPCHLVEIEGIIIIIMKYLQNIILTVKFKVRGLIQ